MFFDAVLYGRLYWVLTHNPEAAPLLESSLHTFDLYARCIASGTVVFSATTSAVLGTAGMFCVRQPIWMLGKIVHSFTEALGLGPALNALPRRRCMAFVSLVNLCIFPGLVVFGLCRFWIPEFQPYRVLSFQAKVILSHWGLYKF